MFRAEDLQLKIPFIIRHIDLDLDLGSHTHLSLSCSVYLKKFPSNLANNGTCTGLTPWSPKTVGIKLESFDQMMYFFSNCHLGTLN